MRHSADSGDGTARAGDGTLLNRSYDRRGVLMASLSHGPGELVLCDRVPDAWFSCSRGDGGTGSLPSARSRPQGLRP
jgi:hypothetical protein